MQAPRFIPNTPDDKHCVQASVGMVFSYFLPDRSFSMTELERFTGFVEGKGAWEMEELLNYAKIGLESRVVTDSSYEEFSKRGFDYLEETDGPKIAQWAKANTGDIELEKKRAGEVSKQGVHVYREPTQDDIRKFLSEGWLVMLSVNARKLSGKPGFVGHRVLIYEANKAGVTMHDPGSPPYPSRKVSWPFLENAWSDPKESTKMLIAVRAAKQ